jgi:flagellar biosynthesis anti-sigma factor FlgM
LPRNCRSPGTQASFDAGRVSEIKQAIAEGRFTINAEAIAERLISLGQRTRGFAAASS